MAVVDYVQHNGVATITLNRPDRLNAMTDELMAGLTDAMGSVANDESVRVVVLTGAGRGFCAGADLDAMNQGDANGASADSMETIFNPAMRALMDSPVPTVARVNGVAAGGGFGLSMVCDITIAARSTFFVATFGPRLGIVPDLGTSWHLPRRIGDARARGVAMLGGRITADEAAEWGMIWQAVDDEGLDDAVAAVTDAFKVSSPQAMTRIRSTLDAAHTNTFAQQLELEHQHQSVLIPANMVEGAAAFMEKREPVFSAEREPSR